MDNSPPVYTGFWIDYTQNSLNRFQITLTAALASAIQILLGVLFGIAAPFLGNILVRGKEWIAVIWRDRANGARTRAPTFATSRDDDRQPLLAAGVPNISYGINGANRTNRATSETVTTHESDSRPTYLPSSPFLSVPVDSRVSQPTHPPPSAESNGTADRPNDGAASKGKYRVSWKATAFAVCLYLVVTVGWAVAGGYASSLKSTSSALSKATVCGSWSLRSDASRQEMDDDDLAQAQKEDRAGQYGRNCYGDRAVTSPNGCDFFDNATIRFDVSPNQPCPFVDTSFCAGGVATAVRFTTGWVDGSTIGLMAKSMPQFNRTTICVPLNLDRGFIKQIPPLEDFRFDYYLGFTNDSGFITDHTFRQFGDPFKWDVPAYSVSAYESTPYHELDYWIPRPELNRKDMDESHTYLTVFFITSCRIVYAGPSKDYIFHANAPFPHTDKYWNPDPRSRPLTCVDWTHLRSSDGIVSHMDEESPRRVPEYEFVRSALRKSTMFQSLRFRLGNGLIAQESVGDFESLALPDDQWIQESRAMFETSLARIQHDALDIAIGRGHEKGQYEEDTLPWARDHLCGMYKFQLPAEYTNINTLAISGLIALAIVLVVAGFKTSQSYDGRKDDCFDGGMLVAEVLLRRILLAFNRIRGQASRIWADLGARWTRAMS